MQYVNVPVPETQVDAVKRHLAWGQTRIADGVDPSAVDRVLERLDAPARALLTTLSLAREANEYVRLGDAAARVGVSPREVMGIVAEANDLAVHAGCGMIVVIRGDESRPVEGTPIGDRKFVQVLDWVAERVLHVTGVGTLDREASDQER